jgi:hypothetical protein
MESLHHINKLHGPNQLGTMTLMNNLEKDHWLFWAFYLTVCLHQNIVTKEKKYYYTVVTKKNILIHLCTAILHLKLMAAIVSLTAVLRVAHITLTFR